MYLSETPPSLSNSVHRLIYHQLVHAVAQFFFPPSAVLTLCRLLLLSWLSYFGPSLSLCLSASLLLSVSLHCCVMFSQALAKSTTGGFSSIVAWSRAFIFSCCHLSISLLSFYFRSVEHCYWVLLIGACYCHSCVFSVRCHWWVWWTVRPSHYVCVCAHAQMLVRGSATVVSSHIPSEHVWETEGGWVRNTGCHCAHMSFLPLPHTGAVLSLLQLSFLISSSLGAI